MEERGREEGTSAARARAGGTQARKRPVSRPAGLEEGVLTGHEESGSTSLGDDSKAVAAEAQPWV